MDTAFVTFIYPSAEKFFLHFIKSLKEQTDSEFKLIVFNDGCRKLDAFYESGLDLQIIENDAISIAKNRMSAFKKLLKSKYEYYIFGDIDDIFANNRVEVVKESLKKHSIIINELHLCNEDNLRIKENLVSSSLGQSDYVDRLMNREVNYIGFSHLALKKQALEAVRNIKLNDELKIIDWVIATFLLQQSKIYFESKTYTNYISHEHNIAIHKQRRLEDLIFTLDVKIQHYKHVQLLENWYKNEMKELQKIKTEILNESQMRDKFMLHRIDQELLYYPWWQQISNSKELKNEIYL